MRNILFAVLVFVMISIFSGCEIFDKNNTSHPNDGGINLEVDWSITSNQPPETCRVRVVTSAGTTRDFNFSGKDKLLVVMPGEAMLYVYNEAEHISVTGKKAKINSTQNPGLFYSYSSQVFTERDKDISHVAVMTQQTGELKISLAIKPAAMISKVKNISAVLEGVFSELDLQTNELSASSFVNVTFAKSAYYASALVRVLGFDTSLKPSLQFEIELENGIVEHVTSDIASLVSGFNQSKNAILSLTADLNISNEVTINKWERNTAQRYLSVFPSTIEWESGASTTSIEIITDQPAWSYLITSNEDWLTAIKSETQLVLTTGENNNNVRREATVQISAGGLNENVTVVQNPAVFSPLYNDKATVKLQSATVGKGVNIILMGDGYTINDMDKGTGKYERDMRATADFFFSIYPYSAYRDHFNVYMVVAISEQEGISNESTNTIINNRFQTIWEGGHSTGIDCNENIVYEYVDAISDLAATKLNDLTVIMPINANIYAGTCYMWPDATSDYANGFSISMCPTDAYYNETVMHEAGGHGFAKLRDEYYRGYNPNETIPNDEKERIKYLKKFGWSENVDFYSDILLTSWKGFAGIAKYDMVGAFEGANYYGKGIWRPELNSCMNDNVPYYNAPSRWAQIRRIKRLAGFNYSFSQFLQEDVAPSYPTTTRRLDDREFIPLAPPVIKGF